MEKRNDYGANDGKFPEMEGEGSCFLKEWGWERGKRLVKRSSAV